MNPGRLAALSIDAAIRGFNSQDPNSYRKWDLELESTEEALRNSASNPDPLPLSSVCQERIRIAFEAGEFNTVVSRTTDYLSEFSKSAPGFSLIVLLRLDALHAIGAHEQEVDEGLQRARNAEFHGSELIHLLASLAKRHPGSFASDAKLYHELKDSIDKLRTQGFESLPRAPSSPTDLEILAVKASDELRRINRERGAALLAGE